MCSTFSDDIPSEESRVQKANVCGDKFILRLSAQLMGIHRFIPVRHSWLVAKCICNTYATSPGRRALRYILLGHQSTVNQALRQMTLYHS